MTKMLTSNNSSAHSKMTIQLSLITKHQVKKRLPHKLRLSRQKTRNRIQKRRRQRKRIRTKLKSRKYRPMLRSKYNKKKR